MSVTEQGAERAVRVLVLDNYDSFTYNLVQYLGELGADVRTVRNDRATVEELLAAAHDRCVVSPGPCTPDVAGITLEVVRRMPESGVPTLGVCLGHQALAQAFGGRVRLNPPVHGKATTVEHDGRTIFRGLSSPTDGWPLSLARGRPRAAGLPRGVGARRGRPDGRAPSRAARRGGAVPSRVRADGRGQEAAGELPPGGLMPNATLTRAIDALASRRDLSAEETADVLAEIMHGEVSETQIAGFLIALRTKGETVDELAGLARAPCARSPRTCRARARICSIRPGPAVDDARSTSPRQRR